MVRLWKFLLFTNILIASAAAAQVLLSYDIFGLPYDYNIVFLEFFATLLLYNLSIWNSRPKNYKESPYERTRWIFGNMYVFWSISAISLLALVFILPQIHIHTFLYLMVIGGLSLAYAMPIVKVDGKWRSFRHVPYVKVFHIALIWSLSTVGLVYIEIVQNMGDLVSWTSLFYLLACKFLFILLITLPFDIRDMKQDSYYHLKTLPLALGLEKSQRLCYTLAVLHVFLLLFMPTNLGVKVGLGLCDILVLILFKTKIFKDKDSFINVYLLDLILVIQFALSFLGVQVFDNFIR